MSIEVKIWSDNDVSVTCRNCPPLHSWNSIRHATRKQMRILPETSYFVGCASCKRGAEIQLVQRKEFKFEYDDPKDTVWIFIRDCQCIAATPWVLLTSQKIRREQ